MAHQRRLAEDELGGGGKNRRSTYCTAFNIIYINYSNCAKRSYTQLAESGATTTGTILIPLAMCNQLGLFTRARKVRVYSCSVLLAKRGNA